MAEFEFLHSKFENQSEASGFTELVLTLDWPRVCTTYLLPFLGVFFAFANVSSTSGLHVLGICLYNWPSIALPVSHFLTLVLPFSLTSLISHWKYIFLTFVVASLMCVFVQRIWSLTVHHHKFTLMVNTYNTHRAGNLILTHAGLTGIGSNR